MKRSIKTTVALAVLAGLCIGCGKSEKAEKADSQTAKPAEQEAKAAGSAQTEVWKPESVAPPQKPARHSHDHGGHSHSH